MTDSYIYGIVALLPLAASMLVVQANPYHALVLRGILGAVAALVYTVLGAADVALTEALVGTMLAITLYAVAVRSSLVMRLGVLKNMPTHESPQPVEMLMTELRSILSKRYLRLELVSYTSRDDLRQALLDKEVHAICTPVKYGGELKNQDCENSQDHLEKPTYQIEIRIRRIYEIMQAELPLSTTSLVYVNASENVTVTPIALAGEKHS